MCPTHAHPENHPKQTSHNSQQRGNTLPDTEAWANTTVMKGSSGLANGLGCHCSPNSGSNKATACSKGLAQHSQCFAFRSLPMARQVLGCASLKQGPFSSRACMAPVFLWLCCASLYNKLHMSGLARPCVKEFAVQALLFFSCVGCKALCVKWFRLCPAKLPLQLHVSGLAAPRVLCNCFLVGCKAV